MKKIIIISLAIIVSLGVIFFILYQVNNKHEKTNSNEWTSQATFFDQETGLALNLPKTWQDISYKIKKEKRDDGIIVFSLSLPYVNPVDDLKKEFITSDIFVVPVASYPMKNVDMNLVSEEKLGANSQYVFVSRQYSPEAFGVCIRDKEFYQKNKLLCDGGSNLRNPERNKGNFTLK